MIKISGVLLLLVSDTSEELKKHVLDEKWAKKHL